MAEKGAEKLKRGQGNEVVVVEEREGGRERKKKEREE